MGWNGKGRLWRGAFGAAVLWALGSGLPSQAWAQGRPDSLRMSCQATQALVSTRGAVVIGTGPDLYDRFVATQGFCQRDETTDPVWLPTADQRLCFIGYRCKRVDYDFDR